jgi:hypothetical protein
MLAKERPFPVDVVAVAAKDSTAWRKRLRVLPGILAFP